MNIDSSIGAPMMTVEAKMSAATVVMTPTDTCSVGGGGSTWATAEFHSSFELDTIFMDPPKVKCYRV